ncbi:MAG TPA: hypothetical protein VM120_00540 [Bryobacteraceae bacterium]|nr:hypothetical protein [Bryobacteraceae bacterium]
MLFDPAVYGKAVAEILALDGNGSRLMPLAGGQCSSEAAKAVLGKVRAHELFPASRAAEAALSGLWLYFSCLDESHKVSQDVLTAEGTFWHGILHRQEPDPGNAGYWFRRLGTHPVFPRIAEEAATLGYGRSGHWDALAFVDYCEQARRDPGSEAERSAMRVQLIEWQVLFDYCASAA